MQEEESPFSMLQQMRETDGDLLPHEIRSDYAAHQRDANFHEGLFSGEEKQVQS